MTREDFTKDNCKLYTPIAIFSGIFMMTGGKPCEGCGYRTDCQNYYMLHPNALRPGKASDKVQRPNKKRPKNKGRAAF